MTRRPLLRTVLAVSAVALAGTALTGLPGAAADTGTFGSGGTPVSVEVFAPKGGDDAGFDGKGWFVDLRLDYPGGPDGLRRAGFTGFQLTGPAAHNNVPPMPGTFSTGRDDRLPGVVVLVSTTNSTRPGFSGPGTNLANLFNLTGVTDRSADSTQLWDTWIVGDSIAGKDVDAVLRVAVVDDLNGNGVYDDAPAVVKDTDRDGDVDDKDLQAVGLASGVREVPFHINGGA